MEGISHIENMRDFIDKNIFPAVEILNKAGFETFESCQGGEGHCFPEATVRFWGNEFDLIRAFSVCELYKLNVFNGRRVYRKTPFYENQTSLLGEVWDRPFNELTFLINSETGTIFLPG